MLEHLHSQLEERFSDTGLCHIIEFLNLLPSKLCDFNNLKRKNSYPKEVNTLPQALAALDKSTFPNLFILMRIGATLPATSATCERSISTLSF